MNQLNPATRAAWLAVRPRVLDAATLTGMAEQRLRTNATVVPIGRTTTNVTLPLQTLALALSQLVGAQEQIDLATKAHPEVLSFLPNVTGFRLVPVSFQIASLVNSAALGGGESIEMGGDLYNQILNDVTTSRQFLARLAEVLLQQ
jgi:hypothetical protein